MIRILSTLEDAFGLIYPNVCVACGSHLPKGGRYLCTRCLYQLPRTNFHHEKDNPVEKLFWGRVNINRASSMFHYTKGSKFPRIIHIIKYQGQKELGYEMGKLYGRELTKSPFRDADVVVPVPLHAAKKSKRGYNQSEWIGKGLAETFQKPMKPGVLFRAVNTKTQTKRHRFERWENVENIFKLRSIDVFRNKHVLLVDDVITTGATLESCAHTLLKCSNTSVSILTLAYSTL